jgi:hypothetical protein
MDEYINNNENQWEEEPVTNQETQQEQSSMDQETNQQTQWESSTGPDPQWQDEPEKPKKKKTGKGKRVLQLVAAALVFGLVAGLTMQGVLYGFSKAGVGTSGHTAWQRQRHPQEVLFIFQQ